LKAGEPEIREARKEDIEQAAELVVRMKKLNGEFDPLFGVVADAPQRAVRYVSESMGSEGTILLVAAKGSKVLGVLRAEVRERHFYEPSPEGAVTDLYLLPEARRKGLGELMLKEAWSRLRRLGAEMMTAEFPAQNEIAARFYRKRGFRSLLNHYAKEELA
jgi:ribosomal protein S18 acetylase RimI-like enzyme